MLFTTKALLHARGACPRLYHEFFTNRAPVSDDEPIPLIDMLERSGLDDALRCLRATTVPSDCFARLFAADFAEHVLPLFEKRFPDNPDPRRAIETARRFARGQATEEELKDAYRNARAAGRVASAQVAAASPVSRIADSDFAAARAAAYAAEAAVSAAYAVGHAAADYDADVCAAYAAAEAAAHAAYYATYVAYTADRSARLAAHSAAVYAARAAYYAAEAASHDAAAAAETERRWQTEKFKEALLAHH
jgi:hypothetical protein